MKHIILTVSTAALLLQGCDNGDAAFDDTDTYTDVYDDTDTCDCTDTDMDTETETGPDACLEVEGMGACETINFVFGTDGIECLPEMEASTSHCAKVVQELFDCTHERLCDPESCICALQNYTMGCQGMWLALVEE